MPFARFGFHLRRRIRQFESDGVVKIVTAYSAVQDGTRWRVQDAVRCHADEILELMAAGGNYLCLRGSRHRRARVAECAFAEIYQRYAGVSADEGVAWLEELRATNRYLEDVWAAH